MIKAFTKNLSFLLVSRIVYRLFWAFMLIVAARYLGAESYGQLETATAFVNAFIIFAGLGMSMLMIQIGSRQPKQLPVLFGNAILVNLAMAVGIYAGLLIGAPYFGYSDVILLLIAIIGIANLAFEVRKPIRALFQIRLNMKAISLVEMLNGVLAFGLVFGITYAFTDTTNGLIAIAVVQLILNVLMFGTVAGLGWKEVRPRIDLSKIPSMLKKAIPFSLYLIFFQLYFQIDQIMLSVMNDSESVGYYAAGAKLILFLLIIPEMANQLLSPIMYRLKEKAQEEYQTVHWAFHRYLVWLGAPITTGIFLLAPQIIHVVYGPGFASAAPGLQIFAIYIFFLFFGNAAGNNLTTLDKQPLRTTIQVLTIVLKVGINLALIPYFGFLGAVIGTTITEAVHKLTYVAFTQFYLKGGVWKLVKPLVVCFPALVCMAVFVFVLRDAVHLLFVIPMAAGLYGGAMILFRALTPMDKNIIRTIFTKDAE